MLAGKTTSPDGARAVVRRITAAALLATLFLPLFPKPGAAQFSIPVAKPVLRMHLVKATNTDRGPRYDRECLRLKGALGGINRRYFRYVRGIRKPVTPGKGYRFQLPVGTATITVNPMKAGRWPIQALWTLDEETQIARISHRLAPDRMLTIGGPGYKGGNLCMILRIEYPEAIDPQKELDRLRERPPTPDAETNALTAGKEEPLISGTPTETPLDGSDAESRHRPAGPDVRERPRGESARPQMIPPREAFQPPQSRSRQR